MGDMQKPTWAVAALGDEPAQLIAAFARHHRAIGAAEVHVFLDRPNPELMTMIGDHDGIFITTCDQDYWNRVNRGKRPERHTGRQKFVSTSVYQSTSCDWVLHCDVDEFVADGEALTRALTHMHRDTGLILRNSERVYLAELHTDATIFDGGFRQPILLAPEEANAFYGRFAKFLAHGLTGHRIGKTIVPTGRPWEMGVHHPLLLADGSHPELERTSERFLLHFDGLTPLHYTIKLLKRAFENYSGPKRKIGKEREAQYRFARNHADRPTEIIRMVEGVQSLNISQAEKLTLLNVLNSTPFMPQDCEDLDLSREAFDTVLRQREAAILAKAGLEM